MPLLPKTTHLARKHFGRRWASLPSTPRHEYQTAKTTPKVGFATNAKVCRHPANGL